MKTKGKTEGQLAKKPNVMQQQLAALNILNRQLKRDRDKTKAELIQELENMRQRVTKLQASEIKRKVAEKKLRESEKTNRAILDATPDLIAVVDNKGIILSINESMAKRFGKRPEELIGKHGWELVAQDQEIANSRRRYFEKVLQTGQTCRFEDERRGTYFDNILYPILEEKRHVAGVAFHARDITESKQAEEALRESEEKFRTLSEKSNVGIYILQDAKVVYVNPCCAKIFGYEPEEMIGKLTLKELIHPDDIDIVMRRFQERLEGKLEKASISYRCIRKDGSVIWVEVYGMLIEYQGKTAVMGMLLDITERRNIEKRMQEARDLERTRLARELHDTVSQTLASAGMIAEVLPRIWEKDPKEANGRLQELSGLTRGAQEEMNSLLYELYPTALIGREPGELIHQLANNVKRHYQLAIDVQITGQFNLTPELKVAFYRITQEALNNITKHSKAKSARISLSCDPNQTTLRISDDGTGFNVSKITGEGMGMRNMRERAEEIGASFDIRSTTGKGTEITVKCKYNSGKNRGGNTN